MANKMLNQSVHLRQAASDYLSQAYKISFKLDNLLKDLRESLCFVTKSNVPNTLYQACKYYIIACIYINLT